MERSTPIANGWVGHLYIHHGTLDQSDIAEGVFAQVEHIKGHEYHMDRVAHPLEVRLAEQFGHGRG